MKRSHLLFSTVFTTTSLLLSSCGNQQHIPQENPFDEVIDIGYSEIPQRNKTNAVSKIKVRAQEEHYRDIYDYIKARAAGVQVTPDRKIIIRGISSFYNPPEPLVLVDGVEFPDISSINPYDVDSISIIKDGTAAIYGSRGAGGVILIKTKRGDSQ